MKVIIEADPQNITQVLAQKLSKVNQSRITPGFKDIKSVGTVRIELWTKEEHRKDMSSTLLRWKKSRRSIITWKKSESSKAINIVVLLVKSFTMKHEEHSLKPKFYYHILGRPCPILCDGCLVWRLDAGSHVKQKSPQKLNYHNSAPSVVLFRFPVNQLLLCSTTWST